MWRRCSPLCARWKRRPERSLPERLDAVPRHHLVGVLPARQGTHALDPGMEIGIASGPIVAALLGRIEHVSGEREVGDRGLVADDELGLSEVLLDDAKRAVETALQEREHIRVRRVRQERLQEAVGREVGRELVIVEHHPAQRFQPLVLVRRRELSCRLGQMSEDHARLRELPAAEFQHGSLTHLVDGLAPLGIARRPIHEIGEHRFPIEVGAVEIERNLEGVPRLAEAVQLVGGHDTTPRACT